MRKPILITALLFVLLAPALAQHDQTNLKIMMNVTNTESSETNSYELKHISYYYNPAYSCAEDTTETSNAASISVNCSISGEDVNTFLLLWMTQKSAAVDGEIVITDLLTSSTVRKFTFSGARITNQGETFSKGASYGYGSELSLTFKELQLDGVDLIE